MQRKSTEFTGWQSAIQYLDEQMERENEAKKPVVLQQREVRQSRPVWRWLKDRWLWMRFFSWQ